MKIKLFLLFSFGLSLNLFGQNNDTQKKFEQELHSYFRSGDLKKQEIVNSETKDKIFKLFLDNSFVGYAILASAKGRMDTFDFVIIYNSQKEIKLVKVLVYRSQHGQEITNKNWLKQFYKNTVQFVYGKDIQAISGATLSAKSITEKINTLNFVVSEISTF
ncbi:MAG: hypothetical protein A2W99_05845 [Bacteroidetes bacterium GWF2_33_16]|nr:MAG: hypothetical protein A2X00_13050 [Bacteroidetes bacterium GWE2_32_14]OFY05209.1 MAG: hypothetical protein A2W99_05845 [Bacteroidetes bacterium GWF2_33_16]